MPPHSIHTPFLRLLPLGLILLCSTTPTKSFAEPGQHVYIHGVSLSSAARRARLVVGEMDCPASITFVDDCPSRVCSIGQGGHVVCAPLSVKWPFMERATLANQVERQAVTWEPMPTLGKVLSLAASSNFWCALTVSREVRCWDERDDPIFPYPIPPLFQPVVGLSMQADAVYAHLANGTLLAFNIGNRSALPVRPRWRPELKVMDEVACVLDAKGQVQCTVSREGHEGNVPWANIRGFPRPVVTMGISSDWQHRPEVVGVMRDGWGLSCNPVYPRADCRALNPSMSSPIYAEKECSLSSTGEVFCWFFMVGRKRVRRIHLPEPAVELSPNAGYVRCARLQSGRIACFHRRAVIGSEFPHLAVLNAPPAP